jgi:C4-type Zn-finger protein
VEEVKAPMNTTEIMNTCPHCDGYLWYSDYPQEIDDDGLTKLIKVSCEDCKHWHWEEYRFVKNVLPE